MPDNDERRSSPRACLVGRPALLAAVEVEGTSVPTSVMPHDLSSSGLRGKWDTALPEGADFALELELSSPARLTARTVWQRRLPRGRALAGVRFTAGDTEQVARYLEVLTAESRRSEERRDAILPIEVVLEDSSMPALASNVSRSGLQISNDFRLPDDGEVLLLLPLDWSAPLEVSARVRWQQPTMFEGFDIGLELIDPSPEVRAGLDRLLTESTA